MDPTTEGPGRVLGLVSYLLTGSGLGGSRVLGPNLGAHYCHFLGGKK